MAAPKANAPLGAGQHRITLESQEDVHPGSMGLITYSVHTMHGLAGHIFSVYPPEIDPANFPTGPHYRMHWGSRDREGLLIEEPHAENSSFYLASALAKRSEALHRGDPIPLAYIGRREPSRQAA